MRWRAAAPWIAAGALGAVAVAVGVRFVRDDVQCGAGFQAVRARCVVPAGVCPMPLVDASGTCSAPELRVLVPAARFHIGPSDWEAEGRVPPRAIETHAFYIDAFEAHDVGARALSAVSRNDAALHCAARGGRLPTDDEWIAAASSGAPSGVASRYPWGETGAVCRRAAWGLSKGPCAHVGEGPDTVGAHPAGDTPLGVHDMAGNVAEWVAPSDAHPEIGVARGGSWRSALATELRVWSRLEIAPSAKDPRIGMRCVYDVPR